MTDEHLRQRFLQEAAQYELTAEKIVETVKIKETSILQVKAINHDAKESIDYIKDKTRKYRDNKYTIEKRELENNEEVFVKDLRKVAKIAYRSPESDRSYILDTDKRFIRRNRQMIIPLKNTSYVTRSGRISKPPDRLIEIN